MPKDSLQLQADYQIYADQLYTLGHGLPLWEPAPQEYDKVNIADVGYVRQGCFHRLFNAALSADHAANKDGVPRDFIPLDLGRSSTTIWRQPRVPRALHTQNINAKGAGIDISATPSWIAAGGSIKFESSASTGAILLTNHKTYREDVVRIARMEKYMLEHAESWLEFASEDDRGIGLEDLMLITGYDVTSEYAMAAFSNTERVVGIEFQAGVTAVASASIAVWGSWQANTSVHHNCGPQIRIPPSTKAGDLTSTISEPSSPGGEANTNAAPAGYNQCLFLRRIQIRKRAKLFPVVIKGGAGPHDLGSGHRRDESTPELDRVNGMFTTCHSKEDEFVAVSDLPQFRDPLEPLFDYIFANSQADVVVLHDMDMQSLFNVDRCRHHSPVPRISQEVTTPCSFRATGEMESMVERVAPCVDIDPDGVARLKLPLDDQILLRSQVDLSLYVARAGLEDLAILAVYPELGPAIDRLIRTLELIDVKGGIAHGTTMQREKKIRALNTLREHISSWSALGTYMSQAQLSTMRTELTRLLDALVACTSDVDAASSKTRYPSEERYPVPISRAVIKHRKASRPVKTDRTAYADPSSSEFLQDLTDLASFEEFRSPARALLKCYQLSHIIKVYKPACIQLLSRCVELLLALRSICGSMGEANFAMALSEAKLVIGDVSKRIHLWSTWTRAKALILLSEIRQGLASLNRDLVHFATWFDIFSTMNTLRKQQTIDGMTGKTRARIIETLQELLNSTSDTSYIAHQPERIVMDHMLGLQEAIHATVTRSNERQILEARLLTIHRQTGLLPPIADLTGEVRIAKQFSVDLGECGDIYLGKWLSEEDVALTRTRTQGAGWGSLIHQLLVQRLDVWRRLRHRNIVRFYGIAMLDNQIYMISKWMDRDVLTYLAREPDLDRLKILNEIAHGVEFLHKHGVVHGDLRGANIMVSSDGVPCITYFGLSDILGNKQPPITNDNVGSIRWFAPELIKPELIGLKDVKPNAATDVWSYGMLGLEIFTDRPPFYDLKSTVVILTSLVNGILPARPPTDIAQRGLSDGVWDLLQQCWSQDPYARPFMRDIIAYLKVLLNERSAYFPSSRSPATFHSPPRNFETVDVINSPHEDLLLPTLVPHVSPSALNTPAQTISSTRASDSPSTRASGSPSTIFSQTLSALSMTTRPTSAGSVVSAANSRLNSHNKTKSFATAPCLEKPSKGPSDIVDTLQNLSASLKNSATHDPMHSRLNVIGEAKDETDGESFSGALLAHSPVYNIRRSRYVKYGHDGVIEAATLTGLIERLVFDSGDYYKDLQFQETFLASYQAFANTEDVIGLIIGWFDGVSNFPYTSEQRASVRYSVLGALESWLHHHRMGWRDSPVLQSVRAFANALEDRGAAPTLVALARKLLEKIDKVALFGSPKSTMVLLPSPSRINLAPRGVAVALTMLESERYRRIIPSDCVDWLKYKSPNALSSFLKEHDKISSWINKSVLRPDRLSDRTERMKYFLCVAEECRKLGNLSSTCAVFNGLSPLPKNIRWRTSGLRTAASVKAIANAADFVSQEHEYQGYYNVLRASQKTCVPWLRAHLHGIRSMHDSRSTFKSQDGLKDVVDFKLYREIQEEVHHMLSYQETQMDHVKDDLDIRTFVESELDSPVVDRSELDSPVGDQPEFDSLVVDHSFYNRPENRTLGPARRKPIAIRSLFALQKMKTFMLMPNKTPRRKPTLATVSEPSISIQSIDTTTSVQDDISERCLDGQVNIRHGLPIAGGYYADVWEGMLGARKIAVKTLRPNSTGTAIITEIQRECLAWTSFNHPNILECLGFSTCVSMNTDLPALISPWMQNGTVLSYLEARPEADRYEHLLGIAQGLSYLHTKQITHGNLRASNVLVSDHGVPLLAGFGGARVIQNSGATAVSRQYLSMRWKSPELFDMNSIPRPSSDVWSYGMTVLEIASGYAPFQELGNSPALYHLIPSGTKPLRPDNARAPVLTDELWALCEDCWSTLPGARPSMGEVISRLDMIRPRHLEP